MFLLETNDKKSFFSISRHIQLHCAIFSISIEQYSVIQSVTFSSDGRTHHPGAGWQAGNWAVGQATAAAAAVFFPFFSIHIIERASYLLLLLLFSC